MPQAVASNAYPPPEFVTDLVTARGTPLPQATAPSERTDVLRIGRALIRIDEDVGAALSGVAQARAAAEAALHAYIQTAAAAMQTLTQATAAARAIADAAMPKAGGRFAGPIELPSNSRILREVANSPEGGQLRLERGTGSLAGDVVIDVYGDALRIFEAGGSLRGVSVPLAMTAAGVTDKVATERFVDTRLAALIGAAPAAIDTIAEAAAEIQAHGALFASLTVQMQGKVNLWSPNLPTHPHIQCASPTLFFRPPAGPQAAWQLAGDNLILVRASGPTQAFTPAAGRAAWPLYINVNSGDVVADGGIWAGLDRNITLRGNGALVFAHGGGWTMTDAAAIRAIADKAIVTGGVVRADGGFEVDGDAVIAGDGRLAGAALAQVNLIVSAALAAHVSSAHGGGGWGPPSNA
jgi:hypothetical protein